MSPRCHLFRLALRHRRRLFGAATLDPHFRLGAASPPVALLIAIIATPLVWGEEFGWRGYLQSRLLRGRPAWSAAATGAIWALWHYPLIVLIGYNYPGSPGLGLIPFTITAILMALILGWLQRRAGSSWAPSLAHSGLNYFVAPMLAAVFPGASAVVAGFGGFVAIPAFAVVAGWVMANGRRPRADAQSARIRADIRAAT